MEIDYKNIGARIKKYRKLKNLTQEKLAELTQASAPHISHIENASTKLSLPTLVSIANALGVSADELICGSLDSANHIHNNEIAELTADCSPQELRSMIDMLAVLKKVLRQQ